MIMPHALALLSGAFPPHRRARALGIFSGVTGQAILGAPMIGGAVVQGLAWPWIFWLNVPIGLIVIPLAAPGGSARAAAAAPCWTMTASPRTASRGSPRSRNRASSRHSACR